MNIRFLILDDEPIAHKVILNYTAGIDYLTHVESAYNAIEGANMLNSNEVDLIFLDINMPRLSGLDFLRTLSNPPKVIITTAYQEYALEGYELDVVDYLMKPFSLERFLKAINKINISTNLKSEIRKEKSLIESHMFIKSDKKQYRIVLDEIDYVESMGSYCKFFVNGEIIITYEKISTFEQSLDSNQFMRIHKSFIIPIKKVQFVDGNRVFLKGNESPIPVGKTYKQILKNWMEK